MTEEQEKEIKKLFGQALKAERKSRKLSQVKLALLAETDPSYIGRVERGLVNVTISSYVNLARSLGCSFPEFFQKKIDE
jgi:transcriptional regulator with XRE-family HTH domain